MLRERIAELEPQRHKLRPHSQHSRTLRLIITLHPAIWTIKAGRHTVP